MKLSKKLLLSSLLIGMVMLMELSCGQTRALTTRSMELASAEAGDRNASSVAPGLQPTQALSNKTDLVQQPTDGAKAAQPVSQPVAVANVMRKKRADVDSTLPFGPHTMHLPCDIDHNGRAQVIDAFPNHCIWVWNNRYTHEGFFRVFKTYQLEAFFFGQYYERLKRFEVDPHTWDYSNAGA